MRPLSLIILMLLSFIASSQDGYKIHINDTVIEISLDSAYSITLDGKVYQVLVRSNDTLTHKDALFSFKYPKEEKVSKVAVDKNVDQIVVLNSTGAGFLIQAYRTLNPETLREMMVEQATKEDVAYGYTLNRTEYERTLSSGQTLKVSKLVLQYKENIRTYEVAVFGRKDEGVTVLTFNYPTGSAPSKDLVGLLWQSLRIN